MFRTLFGASDAVAFILGDASMHPGTSCFLHDEAISKAALLGAVSEAGGGAGIASTTASTTTSIDSVFAEE
eukprot:CAMPEP_0179442202 /NCGR_PEP_ID=MMETSP0799-20121207/25701_1 /TAXON_ID=46947 /ORGANISM="Geminigera cryophila, Strain CCMP2564" /LENGTH=70 /DNA_ID=CAMNT_0021227115 /DNA_START=106 /DNA_END=319 /DNA_ORIENTATION=-